MTQIEQRFYSLAISFFRQYLDDHDDEAKWEQRRYEIARDLYCNDMDISAERAVQWADSLIKELKKAKED